MRRTTLAKLLLASRFLRATKRKHVCFATRKAPKPLSYKSSRIAISWMHLYTT